MVSQVIVAEFFVIFTACIFEINGNDFEINIPGLYNVFNALAAIAVAQTEGVTDKEINKALRSFKGTKRRMEVVGEKNGRKFSIGGFGCCRAYVSGIPDNPGCGNIRKNVELKHRSCISTVTANQRQCTTNRKFIVSHNGWRLLTAHSEAFVLFFMILMRKTKGGLFK